MAETSYDCIASTAPIRLAVHHPRGRKGTKMRALRTPAAAAVALALVVAGCASSKAKTSSTQVGGGSSSSATGTGGSGGSASPVVVGSIQTESSPSGSFKEITDAAQAYFSALNDRGGVNGHKITFKRCNDNADPAKGEDCARQMVDAHAVAVLGGIAFESPRLLPVLTAAGIPYVGGLTLFPTDGKDPDFYPITNAGGDAALAANAYFLINKGLKRGNVMNADVGAPNDTLNNILKTNGGSVDKTVKFPPTAPDLTPYVNSAKNGNPQFVSVQTDGPNTVRIVQGLRSAGYQGQIVSLGTAADPASLKAMGSAGNGTVFSGFFDDPTSSNKPEYVQFRQDLQKYASGTPQSGFALTGYLAAYVTTEAIRAVTGKVTAASTLTELKSLHGLSQFFQPALDSRAATKAYPRTYYFTAKEFKLENGKLVPALSYYFSWADGKNLGSWTP